MTGRVADMGKGVFVSVVLACGIAVISVFLLPSPRIPDHLATHPYHIVPNLLSPHDADEIMDLIKQKQVFPSNVADQTFYKCQHEHIGEAEPLNELGGCDHPYMIPNQNRTACILAGRIDLASHFIKYGGVEGLKEEYTKMTSRLLTFGWYIFDPTAHPVLESLLTSPAMIDAARRVCPPHKRFLDPFQFNFIFALPGQTIAMHTDAPYFVGASRFQFPQWLLVAMVFSGLFKDDFVDQVQLVAYAHRWPANKERSGRFYFWTDTSGRTPPHPTPISVAPEPLSGLSLDGSKVVHAAAVYLPGREVPVIDKSIPSSLVYESGENWRVEQGGKVVTQLPTSDLRISLVYRARCFESEDARNQFEASITNPEDSRMKHLEEVLDVLKTDLIARGVQSKAAIDSMPPLDLAILIMETYIQYPLSPTAWIPVNYCALSKLVPWTGKFLDWIC